MYNCGRTLHFPLLTLKFIHSFCYRLMTVHINKVTGHISIWAVTWPLTFKSLFRALYIRWVSSLVMQYFKETEKDLKKIDIIRLQKVHYNSTESIDLFDYINKSYRILRKCPTKHKDDHSIMVRMQRVLCKARHLRSYQWYLTHEGIHLDEKALCTFLFTDLTYVFNYSLD